MVEKMKKTIVIAVALVMGLIGCSEKIKVHSDLQKSWQQYASKWHKEKPKYQTVPVKPAAIDETVVPERKPVVARIVTKPKTTAAAGKSAAVGHWGWPLASKNIRKHFAETGNKGLVLSAKPGEAIVAVQAGIVVYAGSALAEYGNVVMVKHEHQFLSVYAHVGELLVEKDQVVQQGQVVAKLASNGSNTMHLEIRHKGATIDPMQILMR
jgi:septal ring factor EnvC (AmiA/AmiB activator)